MDEFLVKYNGRSYPEADNELQTPNWDIFGQEFISFIKRQFPGCVVRDIRYSRFEVGGTIDYQDYMIFFNYEVPKVYESTININDCFQNPIIYRERSFRDWNRSSLASFKEDVRSHYIRIYNGAWGY